MISRSRDGKPYLSGVWQIELRPPGEMERIYGGRVAKQAEVTSRAFSKYFFNLLVDFNEEESPIRPEAAALASRRIHR